MLNWKLNGRCYRNYQREIKKYDGHYTEDEILSIPTYSSSTRQSQALSLHNYNYKLFKSKKRKDKMILAYL